MASRFPKADRQTDDRVHAATAHTAASAAASGVGEGGGLGGGRAWFRVVAPKWGQAKRLAHDFDMGSRFQKADRQTDARFPAATAHRAAWVGNVFLAAEVVRKPFCL